MAETMNGWAPSGLNVHYHGFPSIGDKYIVQFCRPACGVFWHVGCIAVSVSVVPFFALRFKIGVDRTQIVRSHHIKDPVSMSFV